jgi:hypothetical protein
MPFTKYCQGRLDKEDEMDGACSTHVIDKNTKTWHESQKKGECLGEVSIDEWTVFKLILKENYVIAWAQFTWLTTVSSGDLL